MQPATTTDATIRLIVETARRFGVSPQVALAFADIESALNPNAIGDRDWPFRHGGANYQTKILESQRLANNPARDDQAAWTSYGLFQLLSAYHVLPSEHPHVLLRPAVNAERGVRFIKRLLDRSAGDVYGARLAYIGCGFSGDRCAPAIVNQARERLRRALEKWNAYA